MGESAVSLLLSVIGDVPLIVTSLASGCLLVDYIKDQLNNRHLRIIRKGVTMMKKYVPKLAEHAVIAIAFHCLANMPPSL